MGYVVWLKYCQWLFIFRNHSICCIFETVESKQIQHPDVSLRDGYLRPSLALYILEIPHNATLTKAPQPFGNHLYSLILAN